jgi:P27 family predicted phage terminase small subunit
MQMDYSADAVILEGACVNYARAIEADEELKDACTWKEPLIDKRTGDVIGYKLKNHPAMARSSTCWRNVQSFCSELGLSLISRQRLATQAGGTTGADELMDLLLGPRPKRDDEPFCDD